MKRLALLLIAFSLAPALLAQVASETMWDESFDATAAEALEVAIGDGDVTIMSGASDEISVQVVVHARDMDRGREFLNGCALRWA